MSTQAIVDKVFIDEQKFTAFDRGNAAPVARSRASKAMSAKLASMNDAGRFGRHCDISILPAGMRGESRPMLLVVCGKFIPRNLLG
jgi:hypothetical protein